MASMAEDFWNKVLKPLVGFLSGLAKKKSKESKYGIEVRDDGTVMMDKKKHDRDDAMEFLLTEFDGDWVLLETKNYFIIRHKSKVDKETINKFEVK